MSTSLALLLVAASQSAVLWLDAYEVRDIGMTVSQSGTYTVWVWAPGNEVAKLSIAGREMEASNTGKKESNYLWLQAGALSLESGAPEVVLGEHIASVVLSTDPNFDPAAASEDRRVYPQPKQHDDARLNLVHDTNTVFTMPTYHSVEAWEEVAERVRRRLRIATGLWPEPERTPLKAKIFDRVTHDDYTVEKVYFEARPGFLVTGNLYRPTGEGPFPGVVCPHGHWSEGRLANDERSSVPARAITLARMGMVVFTYDMIGYVDSLQFKHTWVNEAEKLWGLHPFALQLWSSVRALDFISEIPGVDTKRLACTGASGGGTQTFALMAIDPRVSVAAPVNMISSTMQGGCICENAPIIRLENSNMEIGASMAPRPLLMVSDTGDWTRETPRVEYPAIRSIYELYGAADRVHNVHVDAGHNYNKDSREAMYRFFGKWLLDDSKNWDAFTEPAFTVEPVEALRVFPDGKLPEGVADDKTIRAEYLQERARAIGALFPNSPAAWESFKAATEHTLSDVTGAFVPSSEALYAERHGLSERGAYLVERWVIGRKAEGERVPAILYRARDASVQDTVVVVSDAGKASLADPEGAGPGALAQGILAKGKAALLIDPFLIGECHGPFEGATRAPGNAFADTFMPTDTGYRIQDVLTAMAFARSRRDLSDTVSVVGLGDAGLWALVASAIDGHTVATVIDANAFPSNDDAAWVERYYIPSFRAVGDAQLAGARIAPRPLTIGHTAGVFTTLQISAAYDASGSNALTVKETPLREAEMLAGL